MRKISDYDRSRESASCDRLQSLYVVLVAIGGVRGFGRRRGRLVLKLSGMRRRDRGAAHDVVFRLLRAKEGVELNEVVSHEAQAHDERQDDDDLWR